MPKSTTTTVEIHQQQRWAVRMVQEAIALGKLPRLQKDGESLGVLCVDCSKPAMCYDHRDYYQPLDVQPVCVGCNLRRGPAISVKPEGFVPIKSKANAKNITRILIKEHGMSYSKIASAVTASISAVRSWHYGTPPRYVYQHALAELLMKAAAG